MAVRSKTGVARIEHKPGPPKTTSQGQGQNSRPRRRGRKTDKGPGGNNPSLSKALNFTEEESHGCRTRHVQHLHAAASGWTTSLQLQFKDSTNSPINLTGWTVAAQVWDEGRTTKYADFSVEYVDRTLGQVKLSLTPTQTTAIQDGAYYDVLLTNPSGLKEYYLEGVIYVSQGYTA